jgi:hypothetical protein
MLGVEDYGIFFDNILYVTRKVALQHGVAFRLHKPQGVCLRSIEKYTIFMEVFMQEIGKFSLKNQGGFVTKLQFAYLDDGGAMQHLNGTGNITLGCSETADPGDHGCPDGSPVALYAFVVWGSDNQAKQFFTYKKGNSKTAYYTISGTTLDYELGLNEVK